MDVTTFQCPQCQTVLRLRGKQLSNSQFQCPDCNQIIQTEQTPEGLISASIQTAPNEQKDSQKTFNKPVELLKSLRQLGVNFISKPVLVAWTVAGIVTCLILLLLLFDQNPPAQVPNNELAENANATLVPESDQSNHSQEQKPAQNTSPAIPEPKQRQQADTEKNEQPVPDKPVARSDVDETPELIAAKPEHEPPLIAIKPELTPSLSLSETDITAALELPIVEYLQPKAIPLKTLIGQLEEMLDTEFQLAENVKNDKRLMQTPVSFAFKNTTLSKVVQQILSKEALTFSVKSNKIHIQKAEPNPKRNEDSP